MKDLIKNVLKYTYDVSPSTIREWEACKVQDILDCEDIPTKIAIAIAIGSMDHIAARQFAYYCAMRACALISRIPREVERALQLINACTSDDAPEAEELADALEAVCALAEDSTQPAFVGAAYYAVVSAMSGDATLAAYNASIDASRAYGLHEANGGLSELKNQLEELIWRLRGERK